MRQKFRPKRLAKITKLFFKDYLALYSSEKVRHVDLLVDHGTEL